MVAKGRDAIRAVWGGFLSANKVTECKPLETGYRTVGDTSIGWGRFSMTFQPKAGGAPATLEGRFSDVAVKKAGKRLYILTTPRRAAASPEVADAHDPTSLRFALVLCLLAPRTAAAERLAPNAQVPAILKERVESKRSAGIVVGILDEGGRRVIAYGNAGLDGQAAS